MVSSRSKKSMREPLMYTLTSWLMRCVSPSRNAHVSPSSMLSCVNEHPEQMLTLPALHGTTNAMESTRWVPSLVRSFFCTALRMLPSVDRLWLYTSTPILSSGALSRISVPLTLLETSTSLDQLRSTPPKLRSRARVSAFDILPSSSAILASFFACISSSTRFASTSMATCAEDFSSRRGVSPRSSPSLCSAVPNWNRASADVGFCTTALRYQFAAS
mmetsp:Transcript_10125/g.46331  ORF Transcript_10125/g.46331 Transcript_10125/m.46331 type:complete len:217 (+) Transcript_10125:3301-3951(+)